MVYETNLTMNLLDTVRDSGDYSLTFSVTSGPFTAGTVNTTTRPIIVICMSILICIGLYNIVVKLKFIYLTV